MYTIGPDLNKDWIAGNWLKELIINIDVGRPYHMVQFNVELVLK